MTEIIQRGILDIIGIIDEGGEPKFPRFESVVAGGLTAWYSMRQIAIGEDKEEAFNLDLTSALLKIVIDFLQTTSMIL